ncbi:MAG: hypothetical protein HY361_03330, partial [Candidatus Aenigmarchaeota archaeon]|nr:hypothetical protein [Candidatus Aenigmarchaeota archaeon]
MMEKEGHGIYFNSRDGKVNILMLLSVVLIFVVMMWTANAMSVSIAFPRNSTFNASRNINVTFNVTAEVAGDLIDNCSIWTNDTSNWREATVNNSGTESIINNGSRNGYSNMNYTYSLDGNFTLAVGCRNKSNGNTVFSANATFFIDISAPTLILDTPKGTVVDATSHNITSYETATLYINVSDNSTYNAFLILNSGLSLDPTTANETTNRTMTFGGLISSKTDRRQYYFNLSGIFNFNSTFTSPGPHSVFFCANDSIGRVTCSNRTDFIIKGMNVTQMENIFTTMQQGFTGVAFGGLNITLGNGTEIPTDTFMNPINGVTVGGLTHKNFTFIINITPSLFVHIVAGSVDESQFANASNTKANNTPTREVSQQLGTGYTASMGWVDIATFIPSEVSYQYGIIQIGGSGYSKKMYCNGTTMSAPNCHPISQCNASVFNIYNATPGQTASSTGVIPTNDACWLESGTINSVALSSGFTYIFVDHFSGGLGGSDFSQVNATFNGPLFDELNTTTASNLINYTLDDINSTGLNLTANFTTVTISMGGSVVAYFNYTNLTSSNITCQSADRLSLQNTTSVTCNLTYIFSNGTYTINITAKDTSNNSNTINITTNSINITVDQIPPVAIYYNFTNVSSFNISGFSGSSGGSARQLGDVNGSAVKQGDSIFAVANWSDNLTNPQVGLLQFYNTSAGSGTWQTVNITNVTGTPGLWRSGGWTNFSFPIPDGHNEFEGRNVSWRIITNDSVGNVNGSGFYSSSPVKNFSIQINDTTKPTLLVVSVAGKAHVNGTNTSDTTPTVVWNVTENNALKYIAVQFDTSTDQQCNRFVNYTSTSGINVETKRNGSITVSSDGTCPLANGTRVVRLTSEDFWGNSELYIHSFDVQAGSVPALVFISTTGNSSAVNKTNITSLTGIQFYGLGGSLSVRNLTYVSSCNTSATRTFTNNTAVYPFNESGCDTASANRTLTVTVIDTADGSNSTVFGFTVDNVAPSLAVQAPSNGDNIANIALVNVTALDTESQVDTVTYFLDGVNVKSNHTVNGSRLTIYGQNSSIINRSINFTPGTHTIKISVNDTLGNERNSSVITFTQTGPINFVAMNLTANGSTIGKYIVNVSVITFTNESGNAIADTRTVTDRLLLLQLTLNSTPSKLVNVTVAFNASAANFDKYNFSVTRNDSAIRTGLIANQSFHILDMVSFNNSIDDFVQDAGYYGIVQFPFNVTNSTPGTNVKVQWYATTSNLRNPTNVTECSSTFAPTIAGVTTACWNNTDNRSIKVYVPHFSHIVIVDDTLPPTVAVNKPLSTQTEISFIPNITVTQDTKNCTYSYNASNKHSSQISMTLVEGATESTCIGSLISNLTNGTTAVNISFYVYDTSNNLNQTAFTFSVEDTTVHNVSSITIGSISSTGATVTITANESVNMSINSTGTNSFTNPTSLSTFATTQAISLSSLSASTIYNLTVITCDRANNCLTNKTLGFTTSAAAAAETAAAAASSGGGGGGAAAPSNIEASAARQWDSLADGSSGVLTVNNEKIAVTGVIIDVKNAVTNPSITVESLTSNPLSVA